jgi:hypothetical protein
MSISNDKVKSMRGRGTSSERKAEIAKAIKQLRRIRRSDPKGQGNLDVLVNDKTVIVKEKGARFVQNYRVSNGGRVLQNPDNYRQRLEKMNEQLRVMIENSHNDRERMLRTLKEAPSPEAMAFYQSVVKT